uniref:Uncharacterized protein n=1 Tax=Cacopsylla melanoneura TaxID=428564 RepID=A0A8D8X3R9_9HEMI
MYFVSRNYGIQSCICYLFFTSVPFQEGQDPAQEGHVPVQEGQDPALGDQDPVQEGQDPDPGGHVLVPESHVLDQDHARVQGDHVLDQGLGHGPVREGLGHALARDQVLEGPGPVRGVAVKWAGRARSDGFRMMILKMKVKRRKRRGLRMCWTVMMRREERGRCHMLCRPRRMKGRRIRLKVTAIRDRTNKWCRTFPMMIRMKVSTEKMATIISPVSRTLT